MTELLFRMVDFLMGAVFGIFLCGVILRLRGDYKV